MPECFHFEIRQNFLFRRRSRIPSPAAATSTGFTLRQRMELFIQVCEGVQHAHALNIRWQ
jgi:hypothetical protein